MLIVWFPWRRNRGPTNCLRLLQKTIRHALWCAHVSAAGNHAAFSFRLFTFLGQTERLSRKTFAWWPCGVLGIKPLEYFSICPCASVWHYKVKIQAVWKVSQQSWDWFSQWSGRANTWRHFCSQSISIEPWSNMLGKACGDRLTEYEPHSMVVFRQSTSVLSCCSNHLPHVFGPERSELPEIADKFEPRGNCTVSLHCAKLAQALRPDLPLVTFSALRTAWLSAAITFHSRLYYLYYITAYGTFWNVSFSFCVTLNE